MTTQPKLPDWAEEIITKSTLTFKCTSGPVNYVSMPEEELRTLASRLMAEMIPEGHVVVPIQQLQMVLSSYVPYTSYEKAAFHELRNLLSPNPGPAAEPCKTCNGKGTIEVTRGSLTSPEGAGGEDVPCDDCEGTGDCSSPKQPTYTKVDPPGHAEYVAGKQAEGGGKTCKCGAPPEFSVCGLPFNPSPRIEDFCVNAVGVLKCGHPVRCHEGARP